MGFLRKIGVLAGCLLLIVLLPILIPAAAISTLFDKGRKRGRQIAPVEFAALLRRIADNTVNRGEWDEFESLKLRDNRLDAIRYKAFPFCGRPGTIDKNALYVLAAEAEALPALVD